MKKLLLVITVFIFCINTLNANEKKQIKMCVDPNWMPFEYVNSQGKYEGILAEYIKIFSQKLNTSFLLINTQNYKESLSFLRAGKCDIIVGEVPTSKIREDFLTTKIYFVSPRAFVTHHDSPLVSDISQLINNGTIGVLSNSPAMEVLPKIYPNAKIVSFESIDLGIQNVASKHITTFVSILPSLVYSIQKQGLTNIKIASFFPSNIELSILINKNRSELLPLFNTAIDTLTQADKKRVLDKWVKVEMKEKVDFELLFEVVGILLIFILAIYIKNRTLAKMNKKLSILHKELKLKNDKLTILSNTDSLTGIYNRRKIDSFLQDQVEVLQRYNTPFSVILIDIDHFKLVNDAYGHDIGDAVLIEFSKLIKRNIRTSDKVGRWGGEEFMIVCPHNTKEQALKLAHKLQNIITNYKFEVVNQKTASFGVDEMLRDETIKMFFKRVDSHLNIAKNNGRNQIVF